jgi:hypothetical protein
MNMRIRTKWGQIIIDPERIFEMRVVVNPWDNVYKVEFVMDGTYEVIPADVANANELNALMRRVTNELHFVKQYKFKDTTGHLQINEARRRSAFKERKEYEANNNVQ